MGWQETALSVALMLAEILVFELVLRLPCVDECSERGYRVKLTVKSFHFIEKVWKLVARNTLFFIMEFSMKCEYFRLNGFLCVVKGNLVSLEKKIVSLQHYKPPWFCIFAIFSHLWLHVRFWCCEVCLVFLLWARLGNSWRVGLCNHTRRIRGVFSAFLRKGQFLTLILISVLFRDVKIYIFWFLWMK